METSGVDGRHRRRATNRAAVVQAMIELFADGVFQPTTAELATRAGISERSLFRYFDDLDDLSAAAIERCVADVQPLVDPGFDGADPVATRIGKLVNARLDLYERMAPGLRAARATAHKRAPVARQLVEARAYLRRQISDGFAPELRGRRTSLLPAVDALTSFESYELLREQGLSRPQIATTLKAALTALLTPGGETA